MRKLITVCALCALFAVESQAGTLASKLYGVTGDGGTPAETLFELDKADASSTFVLTLGNGADGEEIAYNPDDGLLYHVSGSSGGRIMETINPGTLAVTPVVLSGSGTTEITGLTYQGSSVLLAADRVIGSGLASITTAGVVANIGATSASLSGLAYIGATLYSVSKDDAELRTINDATGGTLTTVTITLSGYTVSGATGLATNPVDNTLWALLKVSDGISNPSFRALATLDTGTGVATLVGITDIKGLAGIAFVSGNEVTVTSSVGSGSGTISPLGAQSVIAGLTSSFTITPSAGYEIGSVGGTCGGTLIGSIFNTDTLTADCTVVVNFQQARLYGVTGDGGIPAETLFLINMSDASSSLVLTLGTGMDGEEIAFNWDDGLMYHASGSSTGGAGGTFMETIDLDTLVISPVSLSGFGYKEVSGMTYAGGGVLMASDHTTAVGLTSITTAGIATNIGPTDTTLTGLAYIADTLYAVGRNDALLRTINPATGTTLGTMTITMSGFTITGATGLAVDPEDHSMWALLKINTGARVLATIDPATGVATYIGTTDVTGMAGIAFRYIPCSTCEVTPSVGAGSGSITPSSVQNVPFGNTRNFSLTPATGYHIDSVGGTCGGSLAGSTFTISPIYTDCTVVANFAINTYTLTYTPGSGGTVSGASPQFVDHGSSGSLVTAVPNTNFHFVNWSDAVATPARTDTNVTADISVTANFAIDTYTVNSSVGAGTGSISPLGDQQIDHGSSTQFTLTPGVGFHIDSVGGDCGGNLDGSTFTTSAITGPCTVVANFVINTYTLTYTPGSGGTVSGASPQFVDHGSSGSLVTAVPNTNFHFVNWSDAVATPARTDTNVTADISVTANFAIDTYTVNSSVGAGTGSISPLGDQQIDHGSSTQFTLTPGVGFHIDSVGGDCGGNLDGSTFTTSAITGPCTVVANFVINTYTLTYTPGSGGTVSGASPQFVDHGSSGSLVTAVPNTNFHFVNWSDAVATAARTDTNVTEDISVTANFAIDTHTVTSSVGTPSGSITPLGGQEIDHNTNTQFTVTPAANYHIDSVDGSCGGSLVDNTYTTNAITVDCTVVAHFAIDTHIVSSSVGTPAGSISPLGDQEINHGSTTQFTLTPAANYHIGSVDGSCGGLLVDDTFTTSAVESDCTVVANFAIDTHTVTSSVGTPSGSITPLGGQEIDHNTSTQFTVTPAANYHIDSVDSTCGGSLVDDTYTTNAITADCTVIANFEIDTHTVTSSVGTPSGSISPLGDQEINHGSTTQFTLIPAANYRIDSVDGSCGGLLVDDTFTTSAVESDCTVVANFEIDTHTVTSSVGTPSGSITPSGGQEIDHNNTTQFTVTPAANYHIASVGGSCGGLLVDNTYTTNAITAACTVIANFEIDTYTVTSSVGTGLGSITPEGAQPVDFGSTTQFTVTPDPGNRVSSMSGTCGGSLLDNTYTTDIIGADCTVVANFAIDTDGIFSNGFE